MDGAKQILSYLLDAGYEAYIVGGAVRDILMHIEPHDFDIVTSAHPEQVIAVLESHNISTPGMVGKSFGVVIAFLLGKSYEIATYRKETYGEDSHRPDTIVYASTLAEDVLRRDFTVNGLAMDVDGNVIDLVDGCHDIKHKILRTIGNPQHRFQEDALRLFRACRFVAKLDFLPHKDLLEAMPSAFHRVEGLSLERVRQELDQLMVEPAVAKGLDILVQSRLAECSCRAIRHGKVEQIPILPELYHLVNLPQEKAFHTFDGWYHTLAVVAHTEPDLTLRWGALLHDVAKGMPTIREIINGRLTDRGHDTMGADMSRELLTRLEYPKSFVDRVVWIVKNHMRFHYFVTHNEADAVKWARQEARSGAFRYAANLTEAWQQLAQVCAADVMGCGKPHASTDGTLAFGDCMVDISNHMPIHTSDLNYDKRLLTLVAPNVGEMLKLLLAQVQEGRIENNPDALLIAAERRLQRLLKKKK